MKESFLEEQRSVGTFESEGEFTLGQGAARKLAVFNLPDPSFWILKIIQAAVVCGSAEIRIRQGPEATFIAFCPEEPISFEEVWAGFSGAEASDNRTLNHLFQGLRSVGVGQKRGFTIRFLEPDQSRKVVWDGSELRVGEDSAGHQNLQILEIGISSSPSDHGSLVTEAQVLVERAKLCPIPLWLDGRRIDQITAPKPAKKDHYCSYLALGAVPHSRGELQAMTLPDTFHRKFSKWRLSDRFTDDRPLAVLSHSEAQSDFLWQLDYGFKIDQWAGKHQKFAFSGVPKPSQVHWLIDGVICSSEPIPSLSSPVSVQIFMEASDLATDISGFAFRFETQELRKTRRKLATAAFTTEFQAVDRALAYTIPRPFGLPFLGAMSFLGLHHVALGFAAKPFYLLLGGIFAASSARDKHKIIKACRASIEEFANILGRFS